MVTKEKFENKRPDYYEAIIQIRPYSEEVLDFINELMRGRPDVFVSKAIRLKTGVDLYFSSQRYARNTLGPQLRKKFGGELTVTRTIFGRNHMSSRVIYRATILFRYALWHNDVTKW